MFALAVLSLTTVLPQGGGDTGETIYAKRCASCHGANGRGTEDLPDPLVGDRSVASLAKFIAEEMPEGEPEECTGEDARKVAEYVYHAFYSPIAQARNRPPRIELARLTERQHRNAVADVVGTFLGDATPGDRYGLRGEYFNSGRSIRQNTRVFERRDAVVDFRFGAEGPGQNVSTGKRVGKEQFAVRFTGAVRVPATGRYEFVIDTPNGARLWVNDPATPLIERWVRSGDRTRHRGSVFLLGGRAYPLRLEMFKDKKDASAAMKLSWKRPDRVEELIATEYLAPDRVPPVFVVDTPFPPDDESMGYARGATVSKAWEEATTRAAIDVARFVAARLPLLIGTKLGDAKAPARAREFCLRFAERAFRRPLTEEVRRLYVDRQFESADLVASVKRSVILVLKSPRFLFPHTGPSDAWQTASRISFAVWDSVPDRALLQAARDGRLDTRAGVVREVTRMLSSPRARTKLREFYYEWLPLERLQHVAKDVEQFPFFGAAAVADLRDSLDLLLDEVTFDTESDFRRLLQTDHLYLNGRLSRLYGGGLAEDAPFEPVAADKLDTHHAGILTHPLLMAALAYDKTSSPVHRGVFVARSLLGRRLRPPPDAVTPLSPDLHPNLTTRQRVAKQTRPRACQACHTIINPLGFALENFDAVGRFRETEKGKPVDATGTYETETGKAVRFTGARELADFLAGSEEAQAAFIERLFQHAVKQPLPAYGADVPERLLRGFAARGYSIRKLLVDLVTLSAWSGRVAKRKRKII